jgi:fermentation-respiration switch protein FrsA (DUF1100 family)
MRITSIARWLLVAVVLAGCTGGRAPEPTATSAPVALVPTATAVAPTVPAPPAATFTPAPNDGGVTADEPTLAPVAADVATAPAPSPTVASTDTPLPAPTATAAPTPTTPAATATPTTTFPSTDPYPLQIEVMRQQSYPGSDITFEQTLQPGANYSRYIVSYKSDGYKIYAMMTIPNGPKPATGWPAVIFNHGFIPPAQYRTTERYVAYVDYIARSGYIVFKSDYRGHGSSEGPPEGGYGTPGYTDDVLNALASVKAYKDTDPNRIGMWGHSMGGSLTLRAMVVSKDIKAGVIWGGVVGPYPDIFLRPPHSGPTRVPRETPVPPGGMGPYGRPWRQELTAKYGTVQQNPAFWASISPNSYLADISGPLQLDHSTTDEEVPVATSQELYKEMQAAGKTVELYTYPGDNHNINGNFNVAMQRTVAFFDKYVKGQ